ncbi:MAG: MG2 domain-containing protein, partial [Planctomycetota bacterium]|nr:MG2 domain-containing protein [Planctomycetota bacterium]
FDRPFDDRDGIPFVILGEKDDSLSYLELATHELSYTDFSVQGRAYLSKGYDGFVYSDRGVYRPGESVRIESILRDAWNEEPGEFPVQFEILRPDKKRFKLLRGKVDDSGGAGISFKMPGSALTGEYRVALQLPGDEPGELGTTSFLVEDFVPNRMRLSLAVRDEAEEQDPGRRFHPGESIEVDVSGEYLAGLPARDVPVELVWSVSRGSFNPPGGVAAGYSFGDPAVPPLYMKGVFGGSKLDKDGKASFEARIPVIESDRPLVFTIEARALDTSGRGVRSTLDLAVDSAPFYIGLRKGFEGNPKPGVPALFKCIALKENGEAASLDELELVLSRIEWSTVMEEDSNNRYRYRSKREIFEVESHKVELGDGRGEIRLSFPGGGHYRVALRDEPSNRLAAVEVYVKTPGWYGWNGGKKMDKPELLEIEVLSKLLYPGEEARALIRSPFPGTLLLTTETDRVLTHRVLEMKTNHMEVTIPVPDIPFGNAYLSASVIRGVDPSQKWRPHRAYGIAPLWIDYSERQLLVSLQAPSRLRPGDSSATLVRVAGQDGEPVEAQVSLALVDEGILSWTKHPTPDPWSHFYGRQRAHGVSHRDIYSRFLPEAGVDAKPARPGGGAEFPGEDGRRLNPVKAKRFRCAALWLGTFPTGPDGRVLASFDLPQFSGEMRLMAIAHSGSNFGSSEDYIKVRSPLHLELGLPRFLAPGDRFISAVDVFNDTGVRGIAEIDWELSGPLERSAQAVTDLAFATPHTREIGLDIGASRRLFQGVRALGSVGVALARISARLGDEQTEVKVELPVRPAVPLQVNTRTGTITASEPLKLELGDLALPGTARHRICFSPMPSLDLLGSLHYLIKYPHGCLEQTISSVFPLVYLKDLGGMLDLQYGRGEPSIRNRGAEIDVFIQAGIQR